ncbi:MAG: LacI family transcriptional regulator [Lachnospiraceae bacterium]|nr:LacI family transcriptional regulator [Lachnospiraceae bacterium]
MNEIETGAGSENRDKMIRISEIAGELYLSPTTVSRALSGKGRVNEATRKRVLDYVKETGATPHIHVSGYTDKKTRVICVTVPGEKNYSELPFFNVTLMTLCDVFETAGYHMMLAKTKPGNIRSLRDIIKGHKVDGVILTRALSDDEEICYLREKGVPFVLMGSHRAKDVWQVDVDQRSGSYDLVAALVKMGIRKTALMCGNLRYDEEQSRLNGYLDGLQDFGLPVRAGLIFENAEETRVQEKAVGEILREGVECVVCSDDGICVSVMNYFKEIGLGVPRDICIASLFNSRLLDGYDISITSVDYNFRSHARAAGEMLLALLSGEMIEKRRLLYHEILIRKSTQFVRGRSGQMGLPEDGRD